MSSLLATLRPSGVLGDLNDSTFLALEDGGVSQLLEFGWSSLVGAEGSGTIERVDLYARWSYYSTSLEQPDANTLRLRFREGSGGTVRLAGEWSEDQSGSRFNAGPYSFTLSESGSAWDWAKVLTLQLQMECETLGTPTHHSSGAALYELWAEVWGVPASLSPRPSVVVSNVFDRISGSAILKTKEAYASVLDRVSAFGVFPTGDEDMNAAAVQALIDAKPGHPFEFPFGSMKTDAPRVGLSLTGGATKTVFSATGAGIVRNFGWIVSATSPDMLTSRLATLTIKIYVDGEVTPSISLPLFTLAAMEHPDASLGDISASTSAFELTASPHRGDGPYSVVFGASGNFRLPIPFSSGIQITATADGSDTVNLLFVNVIYQDTLPECWNKGFRLRAYRSSETIAAASLGPTAKVTGPTTMIATSSTWPTNIVGRSVIVEGVSYNDILALERVSPTQIRVSERDTLEAVLDTPVLSSIHRAHEFLNLPAGKSGYLALIVAGLQQPGGDGDFLFEGNVRYFLGGEETPSLEWSSVEDWAMGSYYFEQPNRTDEGGIMSHDTYVGSPTKISAYKNHGKHPIKFTNGIRCTVPQYSSYGPATFNWTTFYYEDTASA